MCMLSSVASRATSAAPSQGARHWLEVTIVENGDVYHCRKQSNEIRDNYGIIYYFIQVETLRLHLYVAYTIYTLVVIVKISVLKSTVSFMDNLHTLSSKISFFLFLFLSPQFYPFTFRIFTSRV